MDGDRLLISLHDGPDQAYKEAETRADATVMVATLLGQADESPAALPPLTKHAFTRANKYHTTIH